MIVRRAEDKDFSVIATIQAESWRDAYSDILPEDYVTYRLDDDLRRHWNEVTILPEDVVLVAEKENEDGNEGLIGFIAVWCRPGKFDAFIDNLHVKPMWRSRQAGAALMKAAAQQLFRDGRRTAYLWAVENNERAIRFYERLGGIRGKVEMKDLFGYQTRHVQVVWDNLSRIINSSPAGPPM